jgi:hypothetical protein
MVYGVRAVGEGEFQGVNPSKVISKLADTNSLKPATKCKKKDEVVTRTYPCPVPRCSKGYFVTLLSFVLFLVALLGGWSHLAQYYQAQTEFKG